MDTQAPAVIKNHCDPQTGGSNQKEPKQNKHHGGSFGNYMAYKNQKLQEQFSATAAVTKQSNLFQDVGIYVNGWTSPSHSELKQLMAVHGGRFENYYSRSTVTHIICSNLPDAKVKHFEKERNPVPVVRPEWIVQSIEAGKLLPITDFILWKLRGGPGQRTLQDAFAPAAAGGPAAAETAAPAPQPPPQLLQQKHSEPAEAVPSTSMHQIHLNNSTAHIPYDATELAIAQEVAAQMRADCDNLKAGPRSSKDDPNFVESFYRASRLHFIGTWKARLETLMASAAATTAPTPAPYTLGGNGKRVILHLDMDCFFASVAEAGHTEFKGKPLAVCHSNSARGSGEISSANYEARKYGVAASMFMSKAKELCPGLIVVPYEFDKYEVVSEAVYGILLKYTSAVQPVSCDEAFLDITGLGDPETIAFSIRNDIFEATQCTASAGIGPNILLARIATRKAKPNGIFNLLAKTSGTGAGAVLPFLAELSVEDLPGVGWSTKRKLEELGINTVADIHASSKSRLQAELGTKAGALLWDFAHGRDSRRVEGPKPRRSVGAEVNWGVRFEAPEDAEKFVASLAGEVATRMHQGGVRGRTITLKLKRKKPGWTEPVKFLGMGACDSFSKSVTLASVTAAAEDLEREGKVLLRMLRVPYDEIRGMGLAVSRLDTSIGGGSGGAATSAAAGQSPLAAPAATIPAAAAAEGSEASDAGWELDTSMDVSPSSNAPARKTTAGALSQSPSPSGRGTKRKGPASGKQTSLLDMMPPPPPRMARFREQEDGLDIDEEEEQPAERWELVAKYDGLSLTQINADELAALPYQLQKELVSRLPRTRQAAGIAVAAVTTADAAEQDEASGSKQPKKLAVPADFSTTIEPLPAFSQIDRSVLDALPLQLRRELETAYGMKRTIKAVDTTTGNGHYHNHQHHHQHHRQYNSPPKHAAGSSKSAQHHDSKLRRLDAFVQIKDGPAPAPLFRSNATNQASGLNITLSQIDPGVLHELPRELQDEVLRQLQPFPTKSKKVGTGARTVVARSAAAEASRQRQQLEDIQAAQVEGASLENEEECAEHALQGLEGVELPPAIEALLQTANGNLGQIYINNNTNAITIAEVLKGISAAIEEINEVDVGSQPSQPSESSQTVPQLLLKAVMGAISKLGKYFISHNLEGTKKLLMHIKRIGKKNQWVTSDANAMVEALQQRVKRRYGWPLALG